MTGRTMAARTTTGRAMAARLKLAARLKRPGAA